MRNSTEIPFYAKADIIQKVARFFQLFNEFFLSNLHLYRLVIENEFSFIITCSEFWNLKVTKIQRNER